jgi:ADP-heptose:LPS heptosyltransferase
VFLNWTYRLFPPRRVESILLNLMLPIGDTLFTTPTIRALRRRFPGAHIAALVFPTNAGVLHANEDIDEIILHPTGQTFTPLNYLRFLRSVQRKRFTIAVEFRPYVWWLSVLCGVWRRLSLDVPVYQWFIPVGSRPWKHRHATTSYATVARLLRLQVDTSRLVVRATAADRVALGEVLAGQGIGPEERIIVLHPGGEGFRGMKRWEARRFAVLGDRMGQRHGARIVIVGGRDELSLAQEVAGLMRGPAPLVLNGRVSLGQTVALLERCYLFVGNDSAPLHMAGSLGVATVGIFGPTSLVNYRPVGPHVEVARSGIVCSPCFHFVGSHPVWAGSRCRVPTCLHALAIDTVVEAAERALAGKPSDWAETASH